MSKVAKKFILIALGLFVFTEQMPFAAGRPYETNYSYSQKKPEKKTTYVVTNSSSSVTTTFDELTPEAESSFQESLLTLLKKELKTFPFVSSVAFNSNKSTLDENKKKNRTKSIIFVRLQLPASLTLAFTAEEVRDDPEGNPPCQGLYCYPSPLITSLTIKGPISIEGNFTSSTSERIRLLNSIQLVWTMQHSPRKNQNRESRITLTDKSSALPKNLSTLANSLNVQILPSAPNIWPTSSSVQTSNFFRSKTLFKSIVLFLRNINEKVVAK